MKYVKLENIKRTLRPSSSSSSSGLYVSAKTLFLLVANFVIGGSVRKNIFEYKILIFFLQIFVNNLLVYIYIKINKID